MSKKNQKIPGFFLAKKITKYWVVAKAIARDAGVKEWKIREPLTRQGFLFTTVVEGRAVPAEKYIEARKPDDLYFLLIWAHECGHIAYQHRVHRRRLPLYVAEYEASAWAIKAMQKYGMRASDELITDEKARVFELAPVRNHGGELIKQMKREVRGWLETPPNWGPWNKEDQEYHAKIAARFAAITTPK